MDMLIATKTDKKEEVDGAAQAEAGRGGQTQQGAEQNPH